MLTNKELKRSGRKTVKKHYMLLLVLIVVAVLFGNEFRANQGILYLDDLLSADQTTEESADSDSDSDDQSFGRLGMHDTAAAEVIKDILDNDLLSGIELAESASEAFEDSGTSVMGHTEGFLSYAINTVCSGTLALMVFAAFDKITGSQEAATIAFVILGLILYLLIGVCMPEVYAVILRRMFLEARVYERVPFAHAMHLWKVRRAMRAIRTIVLKDVLRILWSLTIAGFFIKRYSYFLVPFIVAENPDIGSREAITLSRKMMDGHKWEAFKYEMSFLHWVILGILTLGLSNVFWYLPYKVAATTEYYACIRQMAKEAQIEGVQRLDDSVLLEEADLPLLQETYQDIAEEKAWIIENRIELTGRQKFFAEKLAIWLGSITDKATYQEFENREYRLEEDLQAMMGEVYPTRLDPRASEDNRKINHQINFLRCYTIWNLMFMFLLFAFIGWVWEVIVFLIQTGEFVNRGTLHGPWVPIYGVGGAMIIVVLSSLRKRPVVEFFAIVILCGVVEYFTSWALEAIYGMRWWDYSGYFLNINGRICLEGLLAFGILGMMAIYLLAPALDTLLMKIPPKLMVAVTSGLMAIFFCDVFYSLFISQNTGTGITDMGGRTVTARKPEPTGAGQLPRGALRLPDPPPMQAAGLTATVLTGGAAAMQQRR